MAVLLVAIGHDALAREQNARLRPPPTLQCERDQLTSYTGGLRVYLRGATLTQIGIHTDEETDEAVAVPHPDADPAGAFLANGRPFTASDWIRLESAPGEARKGLRLTAWVCLDGHTAPVIDWQLPD